MFVAKFWQSSLMLVGCFSILSISSLFADIVNIYEANAKSDFYDSFGTKVIGGGSMTWEMALRNSDGLDSSLTSARYFKSKSGFWNFFKGSVFLADVMEHQMKAEYYFNESGKRYSFSPMILKNNFLDGFFISWKNPKLFEYNATISRLYPYSSVEAKVEDKDYDSDGVGLGYPDAPLTSSDYLLGGSLRLNTSSLFPNLRSIFEMHSLTLEAVNMHHSDSEISTLVSRGAVNQSVDPIKRFYIRVTSPYPKDLRAGAAVYSVRATGSKVVSLENYVSQVDVYGNKYHVVNGSEELIYVVTVTNENLKNLKVEMHIANSYIVQASLSSDFETSYIDNFSSSSPFEKTGLPRDTVLFSTAKVNDFSNLKTHSFQFGLPSALNLGGVSTDFSFLGVNFQLNGFMSILSKKFHSTNKEAEYSFEKAPAGMIAFSKKLNLEKFSLELGGELFSVSPSYQVIFEPYKNNKYERNSFYSVMDNDDDNFASPMFANSKGEQERYENISTLDQNVNGVPDFQEDFLSFQNHSFFFQFGEDENNNDIPDNLEDDKKIDLPKEINSKGQSVRMGIFSKDMALNARLYNVERYVGGAFDRGVQLKAVLKKNLPQVGEAKIQVQLKKVADTLPNNIATSMNRKIFQSLAISVVEDAFTGFDQLFYRNSVASDIFFALSYNKVKNWNNSILFRNKINYQLDNSLAIIHSGGLATIEYFRTLEPISKNLELRLQGKISSEVINSNPVSLGFRFNVADLLFVSLLRYSFSKNTILTCGHQYTLHSDNYDKNENYIGNTGIAEMSVKGTASRKDLIMLVGYKINSKKYSDSIIYDDILSSDFYIRLMVKY